MTLAGDVSWPDIVFISDNVSCPNPSLMFKCSNNKCIYQRWMCDGEDDCPDREDEDPHQCHRKSSNFLQAVFCFVVPQVLA